MHSARQSKLYKFYSDQSVELLNSIKSMEFIDPNNKSYSGDFNILFLGPAGIYKSLLIKLYLSNTEASASLCPACKT